jgi:hypothetical protein
MEWSDILVKIGVGACLGFGIIVLAKLSTKKHGQQNRLDNPDRAIRPDSHDTK